MYEFFRSVTSNNDYSLSIVLESGREIKRSMLHLLSQIRFNPLQDKDVWIQLEVSPTHLEWNAGTYQVTLNIEEIIPDYTTEPKSEK